MQFCVPCVHVYNEYQHFKSLFGHRFPMKMPHYRDRNDQARIDKFKHLENNIYSRKLARATAAMCLKPLDNLEGESEAMKPIENFEKEMEKSLGVKSLDVANSTKDSDEGYNSKKNSPNIENGAEESKNGAVEKSNNPFLEAVLQVMNKKPLMAIKYENDLKLNGEDKENQPQNGQNESLLDSNFNTPNGMQAPLLDGSVPPRKLEINSGTPKVFTPRRKLEFEADR